MPSRAGWKPLATGVYQPPQKRQVVLANAETRWWKLRVIESELVPFYLSQLVVSISGTKAKNNGTRKSTLDEKNVN